MNKIRLILFAIVLLIKVQCISGQVDTQVLNQCKLLKDSDFRSWQHPRILAKNDDKAELLNKINNNDWASGIYVGIKNQVDSLVNRHIANPEYIVSRLQMNWDEGLHYSDFYTRGNFVPRREGNAPYPTVRVTYGRSAFNSTPPPPYEMITPYGNGALVKRVAGEWKPIPFEETGLGTEVTNQKILEDAYRASIVYYFTGEKKYAKFASDILWTFIRGASYQNQLNPDRPDGSNGFLSYETLGDTRRFATLPLTFDFIYDYFVDEYLNSQEFINGRKGERWAPGHPQGREWALERIHVMFEKMLDNKLTRGGGLVGNWNTNEHESALLYALALNSDSTYKDGKGREFYISKFLYGPTTKTHGAYVDVISANLDPETGLWHEPPAGYGQGSIIQLFRLGYFYYNNGIDVLSKFPVLIKAATSFPQVAFPNGYSTNWGDGNYARMQIEHAELLYSYALKTRNAPLRDQAINLLSASGGRNFSAPYYTSLFFFTGDIPLQKGGMKLPETSYSKVHSIIFMRSMTGSPLNSLQYNVYGFGKNTGHKQANGMAMELYGRGEVLGFDPGWGPDYWVDQHVRYNSRSAAHNTVMPNGVSAQTDMPQELEIKYSDPIPQPGCDPVFSASKWYRFTDTYDNFKAAALDADQRRTMGIVRINANEGYFIDIFRSKVRGADDKYHDYIYHNAGTSLSLFDKSGVLLKLSANVLDSTSGFGYAYFKNNGSLDYSSDFCGIFDLGVSDVKMKVWMPGNSVRTLYSLTAPSAPRYYMNELRQTRVPTLLVRQSGEAWTRPFIAIYEPYGNGIESSVKSVRRIQNTLLSDDLVGIRVERTGGTDFILNSSDSLKEYADESIKFKGIYAVITIEDDELGRLYLGTGNFVGWNDYSVGSTGATNKMVKASIEMVDSSENNELLTYSSNEEILVTFPWMNNKKIHARKIVVLCKIGTDMIRVEETSVVRHGKGVLISMKVPAAMNAGIYVQDKRTMN